MGTAWTVPVVVTIQSAPILVIAGLVQDVKQVGNSCRDRRLFLWQQRHLQSRITRIVQAAFAQLGYPSVLRVSERIRRFDFEDEHGQIRGGSQGVGKVFRSGQNISD